MATTTKNQEHVFCLPTYGRPYYIGSHTKGQGYANLRKAVDGAFEPLWVEGFKLLIHPLFAKENDKWNWASVMLKTADVKVYCNQEGANERVPNTATIIGDKSARYGGCPHLFGDICLVIPDKIYKKGTDKPLSYFKPESECDCCGDLFQSDDLKDTCDECEKKNDEDETEFDEAYENQQMWLDASKEPEKRAMVLVQRDGWILDLGTHKIDYDCDENGKVNFILSYEKKPGSFSQEWATDVNGLTGYNLVRGFDEQERTTFKIVQNPYTLGELENFAVDYSIPYTVPCSA